MTLTRRCAPRDSKGTRPWRNAGRGRSTLAAGTPQSAIGRPANPEHDTRRSSGKFTVGFAAGDSSSGATGSGPAPVQQRRPAGRYIIRWCCVSSRYVPIRLKTCDRPTDRWCILQCRSNRQKPAIDITTAMSPRQSPMTASPVSCRNHKNGHGAALQGGRQVE